MLVGEGEALLFTGPGGREQPENRGLPVSQLVRALHLTEEVTDLGTKAAPSELVHP